MQQADSRGWKWALTIAALALAGCAVGPRPVTYADWIMARPAPLDEEQRRAECAWVLAAIAREQEYGHYRGQEAFGWEKLVIRATMEQHILALEKRGRYAGCFA